MAMALSTSVLDLDTTGYFLAYQEIKLGPRKTLYPLVDLISMGSPAQSESQYACNCNGPEVNTNHSQLSL
jgi:hypothetical protein